MITTSDTSAAFTFKNKMGVIMYENKEASAAHVVIRHFSSAGAIRFGEYSESPGLTTDEVIELLNIVRLAADFDACQAAVDLWLFKKQPKPSADEERFLACQTFRDTQSFVFTEGMMCWLDYTDPVEDWVDKDWVLNRGPEWQVVKAIYYPGGDCCITVCQQSKPSVVLQCTEMQLVPDI